MLSENLITIAQKIIRLYADKNKKITTAESCTGGLIAAYLTEISGASAVFERGYVTYANHAKAEELLVSETMLAQYGAVSAEVAEAMAKGALGKAKANIAVAVTGIAGPNGGTAEKPVGLVFIGLATHAKTESKRFIFEGGRSAIREQSCLKALSWLYAKGKDF